MLINKQKGFTLIELMIGLLLGLIVTAMVLTMFISTVGSTRQVNSTLRLNQELRTVLEMMERSTRRAGYWAGDDVANNPHADLIGGSMQFGVFDTGVAPATLAMSGDCLIVSYDAGSDGLTDPVEVVGFRLDSAEGAVEVSGTKTVAAGSSVDCNDDLNWQNLTDERVINITNLSFTVVPNSLSVASLAVATSKALDISITGQVRSDTNITNTIQVSAKLRNSSF